MRFRVALYLSAVELRTRRPIDDIKIEDAFMCAGIPTAGYLRARRLGLVKVVESALHGFPPLDDGLDCFASLDAHWRPFWPPPSVATRRG